MKFNKTMLSSAIATACFSSPVAVFADTIGIDFTAVFSLSQGGNGNSISTNSDAVGAVDGQGNSYLAGSRTPISGTGTFDSDTGIGSLSINAFSFFGGGLFTASTISLKSIGDGFGGEGTLVAGVMTFDFNGIFAIPSSAIFDAAGFFNSIDAVGSSWTVQTGCTGCATSATPDTVFGTAIGAVPIAMTTLNTSGTTLDSLFPLSTDGFAGSPMITPPFPGDRALFDFTTINASNIPQVPIPTAAWLFGTGLLSLIGVARRHRRN